MNFCIVDIETDGLNASKIHCLSAYEYIDGESIVSSLTDYDNIRKFLLKQKILIGHNIIRYDIPTIERVLEIKITARLIDTLPISWYLYPGRTKHGLDEWGEDLGISKPVITDWVNQSVEDYIYRCEQDVQINLKLWNLQSAGLLDIYETPDKALRLIAYLTYKLDCAREQEEVKWKIDRTKAQQGLEMLEVDLQRKKELLSAVMPSVKQYRVVSRPKELFKKGRKGEKVLSVRGERWLNLLKDLGLPDYHIGPLKIPVSEISGNPGSHAQLKEWLFSLGWVPDYYKYEKQEDGTQRRIPQIANQEGTDVSDSVKLLYKEVPELENIEGLFVIRHRTGILKGFLKEADENDFVKAEIAGLTNTLRFQHKSPCVNLPAMPRPYWEIVRGCLISPKEGWILCGSDMSGLESSTRNHYMYYYDPVYVQEMMKEGYDAHTDIAKLAGYITEDEEKFYQWYSSKR